MLADIYSPLYPEQEESPLEGEERIIEDKKHQTIHYRSRGSFRKYK